jgi:transposase-like protein
MTPLGKKEKDQILAAYRSGVSSTAIAGQYGVHPAWVRKFAARSGVVKQPIVGVRLPPRPKKQFLPQTNAAPMLTGSGRPSCSGYLKLM